MDFSPLHEHVCMESSDHWLQGAVQEESGVMDSSSSSPPLMERRVRPAPTDQALKCPRCESTNTKFCYYNNYSLSQPRYFCKTCRRYWTKGGTLRNIPVGGGCRKNKKVSTKKFNDVVHTQSSEPKELQLTSASSNFPDHAMHFPHPVGLMMENSSRLMETKFGGMINNVMGNIGDTAIIADQIHYSQNGSLLAQNFQGFGGNVCYFDGYNGNIGGTYSTMDSFYHGNEDVGAIIHDVKPNPKLLSLEWQDQQGCSDAGKDPFGYNINTSLGSWSGMINGYGASTTNPLI